MLTYSSREREFRFFPVGNLGIPERKQDVYRFRSGRRRFIRPGPFSGRSHHSRIRTPFFLGTLDSSFPLPCVVNPHEI